MGGLWAGCASRQSNLYVGVLFILIWLDGAGGGGGRCDNGQCGADGIRILVCNVSLRSERC